MEQKRAVHQRGVAEAIADEILVGKLRVQTFIVAHHPVAQPPKAGEDGGQDDEEVGQFFPIKIDCSQQRPGQEVGFGFRSSQVSHKKSNKNR